MRKSILFFVVVSFLSSLSLALADVTYEEETKTGGLMKVMMMGHNNNKSTTRVSGDFMRTDHDDEATIIDLNGERIIKIDNKKKTYSVMTFAEMKKKMEEAMASMKAKQAEASKQAKKEGQGQDVSMSADVKVTETGRKETIQGMECKQFLMDMGLTATSEKEKQSGRMSTLMEVWQAKNVPGQAEVQAFYRKMAQKLGTMSIGQMFQGGEKGQAQPMMQMNVQKMADEMKKMDGHTMRSVMYVGDPEAAKKEAMGEKPEGGGGGGGMGGLGGMLKKMKPGQSNEQQGEGSQGQQSPGGVMMKITTETTKIDTGSIDPKVFQIPSGYKQVQAEGL